MNNKDKRHDAAQTLVVSTNATPEMVNAAYERRLKQYMNFNKGKPADFSRKSISLYNAQYLMMHSPEKQTIARIKLAMMDDTQKLYQTLLVQLKICRDATDCPIRQWVLDDIQGLTKQLYKKYCIFRALCMYELVGLGGMMIYDHLNPEHGPVIPSIVYGTMLGVGIALGVIMDAMDKKRRQIKGAVVLMENIR